MLRRLRLLCFRFFWVGPWFVGTTTDEIWWQYHPFEDEGPMHTVRFPWTPPEARGA